MDTILQVLSPLGESLNAKITPLAPRPESLNGKTVCQIWNGGFKSEVTLPLVAKLLKERFPDVKIIPHTEFPAVTIASLEASKKAVTLEAVRQALLAKGCDAVITGNGG